MWIFSGLLLRKRITRVTRTNQCLSGLSQSCENTSGEHRADLALDRSRPSSTSIADNSGCCPLEVYRVQAGNVSPWPVGQVLTRHRTWPRSSRRCSACSLLGRRLPACSSSRRRPAASPGAAKPSRTASGSISTERGRRCGVGWSYLRTCFSTKSTRSSRWRSAGPTVTCTNSVPGRGITAPRPSTTCARSRSKMARGESRGRRAPR